jgi:hypothetical protein
MLGFLLDWLLATVAFMICHVPPDTPAVLKAILAGALVAIAIGMIGTPFLPS